MTTRNRWAVHVAVAIGLLVPLLAGSASPALAAPAPAAAATMTGFAKDSRISVTVEPAAGVPALGTTAISRLHIVATSGVAAVRTTLAATGSASLKGTASFSTPISAPGRDVVLDVPFAVAAAGPGTIDAQVTAFDAAGTVLATRLTHLWVEGFGDGIAQSANGPSDARISRLQRLHAGGTLSDAGYAAALDEAVGTNAATRSTAAAVVPAVVSTVTGHAVYTDSAGKTHPVRRAVIELRAVTATGSVLVKAGKTDDAGAYSVSGDSAGRNLVVRAYSQSDGFAVQTTTGVIYFAQSDPKAPAAAVTLDITSLTDDATHDTNGALNVADAMVTGVDYTKRLRGSKFPDIKVQFPDGSGTNFGGTVGHILRSDRYDWDVNLHEYGHFFADQSGIQDSSLTGDVSHRFSDNLATRQQGQGRAVGLAGGRRHILLADRPVGDGHCCVQDPPRR